MALVQCSSCGLRHSPRADGSCPRCKNTATDVAAPSEKWDPNRRTIDPGELQGSGPREPFFTSGMGLKILGFVLVGAIAVTVQIMRRPRAVAQAMRAMEQGQQRERTPQPDAAPGFTSFESRENCRIVDNWVTIDRNQFGWVGCGVKADLDAEGNGTVAVLLVTSGTRWDYETLGPGNLLLELTSSSAEQTALEIDGTKPPSASSIRARYRPLGGETLSLRGSAWIGRNAVSNEGTYELDLAFDNVQTSDLSLRTLGGGISFAAASDAIDARHWLAMALHETASRAHRDAVKAKSTEQRASRRLADEQAMREQPSGISAAEARRRLEAVQTALTRALAAEGIEQRKICQQSLDDVEVLEANLALLPDAERRSFTEAAGHLRTCYNR